MTDAAEMKKSKDRSPSFPYINLERAIDRARLFYAQEKRGVAPYTRAVLHWGMSEASSAAMQTVSALKAYGLLVEPGGSGKSRQLQISDLAIRILLDNRPDSEERQRCIREAAESPTVAADVYQRWPGVLPHDSTLSHYLVVERRFNDATAPSVIKILRENQQFAGLHEGAVESSPMETATQPIADDFARHASALMRGEQAPPLDHLRKMSELAGLSVPAPVAEPKQAGHTEQLASMDGDVTVSLHFSSKPDADFYEWIAFYASKKAEKMKAAAKVRAADNPSDGQQET